MYIMMLEYFYIQNEILLLYLKWYWCMGVNAMVSNYPWNYAFLHQSIIFCTSTHQSFFKHSRSAIFFLCLQAHYWGGGGVGGGVVL